jgi:hypothetical protein
MPCAFLLQMRDSAKFQLLTELLPDLRSGGHKVLLFSQWTSILDLVEWLMQVLTDGPQIHLFRHYPGHALFDDDACLPANNVIASCQIHVQHC